MQHDEIRSYFKSRIPWYYWIPIIGAMIFAVREFTYYNKQTKNWTTYQLIMMTIMFLVGFSLIITGLYRGWW